MAKDLLFLWHFLLSLVELLVDMPDETFRASSSALISAPYLARLLTLDLFARSAFTEDSATGRRVSNISAGKEKRICVIRPQAEEGGCHRLNMEFIWALFAQMFSPAGTPQSPPPPSPGFGPRN
jgi:hypothetical protein